MKPQTGRDTAIESGEPTSQSGGQGRMGKKIVEQRTSGSAVNGRNAWESGMSNRKDQEPVSEEGGVGRADGLENRGGPSKAQQTIRDGSPGLGKEQPNNNGPVQGMAKFPYLTQIGIRKAKGEKGARTGEERTVRGSLGEESIERKEEKLQRESTNQARWERAKLLIEGTHGGEGSGSPRFRVQ